MTSVTRYGPRIAVSVFVVLWVATARQALIVNPDMAWAFLVLNAYIVCFIAVWELRSRGHGDWPIYLLVLAPVVLPFLVVAPVMRLVLGSRPQEP